MTAAARPPRRVPVWAACAWAVAGGALFLPLAAARRIPVGPEGAVLPADVSAAGHVVAVGMLVAGALAGLRRPVGGGLLALAGAGVLLVMGVVQYSPAAAAAVALAALVPGVLLLAARPSAPAAVAAAVLLGAAGFAADRAHRLAFGPFHPESATPRLPVVSVRWMWSGGLRADGFTVVARLARPGATARLRVTGPGGTRRSAPVRADDRGVARMTVAGLAPGTTHTYAVEVDGRVEDPRRGRARTLPVGPATFTVAVGACATTGSNGRVFDAIRERDPLLMVHTGDFFYGNVDTGRADAFLDPYERTLTSPSQSALYRAVPIAYVWDDHDFGVDDTEADAAGRSAAHATYRSLVPHGDLALPGPEAPIAQALTVGRVRLVITDTRSARDSGASPPTMLGDPQRAWLVREVVRATRAGLLPVWVTSSPWVAEARAGADTWGGFADERAAVTAALRAEGVRSLVVLSGDAHMVALDDGRNSAPLAAGGRVPVLQAAALDERGSVKGGPYSEGTAPGAGRFGTMRVEDRGGDAVRVTLEGWTWDGRRLMGLTRTFPLGPAPRGTAAVSPGSAG